MTAEEFLDDFLGEYDEDEKTDTIWTDSAIEFAKAFADYHVRKALETASNYSASKTTKKRISPILPYFKLLSFRKY